MARKKITEWLPLSERTFIIGDEELMRYVGCKDSKTLEDKFTNRKIGVSLRPTSQIGRTKYYAKKRVDEYIIMMNELQIVSLEEMMRPKRRRIIHNS